MKIHSVSLRGFRCFSDTLTTVNLSEGITTLVGTNGSGKTAFLEALARVFGVTREQRTVRKSDFYADPNKSPADVQSAELCIDVRLSFPELVDTDCPSDAVAPCFRHMMVAEPGGNPFCRIRLEATWSDDGTIDGDIEQKLWWVVSTEETPKEEHKKPLEGYERGLIQVHYVPAMRDAATQLTYATGAMAGRLLKAVAWSQATKQIVQEASQQIREAFGNEKAIQAINTALKGRWKDLHDAAIDAEPELQIISRQFEEAVRHVNAMFRPTETGGEREYDALSDGQKSLFYFSLVAATFDIEQKLFDANKVPSPAGSISSGEKEHTSPDEVDDEGFRRDLLQSPSLTVFAIEEPENHLAPYFLARIVKQVRSITQTHRGQALFTSHSPAILGRIDPLEVRHFRLNSTVRAAVVREIVLPAEAEEAAKYVREAVIAYPELYFARFVILAEGDSEQIVLPRLAAALNLDVDRAFVAITPLGGRHVNYFWRLLTDLCIPYVTLLDLDLGRQGGGWGRIKYACRQLLAIGTDKNRLLQVQNKDGSCRTLSDEGLEEMDTWDVHDRECLKGWINYLESYGVFFSCPIDLDMAMLSHFPEAYKAVAPADGGPRIPKLKDPKYQDTIENAAAAVLGENPELSLFPKALGELLPWYRYLFLNKGKPGTHLMALSYLDGEVLAASSPAVLKKLLQHVHNCIRPDAA